MIQLQLNKLIHGIIQINTEELKGDSGSDDDGEEEKNTKRCTKRFLMKIKLAIRCGEVHSMAHC